MAVKHLAEYIAFFFVGSAIGWFPVDAVLNLATNEPALGATWIGKIIFIGGIVGLADGILYLIYLHALPKRSSLRQEQIFVMLLATICVVSLLLLTTSWQVGAPHYPIVILATVLGNLIVNCTYYVSFPMIATFYGGWLVAPVRTGTDISVLISNVIGEAQNPSGSKNIFPSWELFLIYTTFPVVGLVAWILIVRFQIGLQSGDEDLEKEASSQGDVEAAEAAASQKPGVPTLSVMAALACPRKLLVPVLLGSLADLFQWGVLASLSFVGATMTDPVSCMGSQGLFVARTSTTVNRVLLPVGSMLSSLLPCPRWIFIILSGIQSLAILMVLLAVSGSARDFWTSTFGQDLYMVCNGVVGVLEGYILTMAFRFVGDDQSVSLKDRRTASGLLGFLNVFLVCIGQIVSGQLSSSGLVSCTDDGST
eukprot:CAMPEP_0197625838 /NCGR_PEP_ID=MMETSP1338-20131121/5089_1 /TAXON_ID=43686 ORGANISM="Pelagodinium beii, Strain RCC1491" /NCGR_SAMPLE_ID=MMETSP1338 /ASSEMBLY_ACC=CAM_ASM_000754 /LENGTH=422 /DNA_ID=CAMNT_0043196343 /DNA_START=1230 /DNA_END=2498 /DNA_ORIENTATION=-